MTGTRTGGIVIIGLGNADRADDGIGPEVARRAAAATGLESGGWDTNDPTEVIHRWRHAELAVVVDAVRSGARPGAVQVVDLLLGDDDLARLPASTHGLGLAAALRLSRSLGTAPGRLVLVGVEGADFGWGEHLSPAVAAAIPAAVRAVVGLVHGLPTKVSGTTTCSGRSSEVTKKTNKESDHASQRG